MNPCSYRCYDYDEESGLYYLQRRYYNPEMGRFLNADDTTLLGATGDALEFNLFAYCENALINVEKIQFMLGGVYVSGKR